MTNTTNETNEQTRTQQGRLRRFLSKLSPDDGAPRTMQATWNGAVIAESDDTVLVEGNHTSRPRRCAPSTCGRAGTTAYAPWKGTASYYDVVDSAVNRNAAWYYPQPSRAAHKVTDRVAFSAGVRVRRAE